MRRYKPDGAEVPVPVPVLPPDTKWWKSWTLWTNALALVIEGGQYVAGANIIPPLITIPILAVMNIALRVLKTKGKITK